MSIKRKKRYQRHGMHKSPEYTCWRHMRERCQCPNTKQFKDYGGRGIKVCFGYELFEHFLADLGKRPFGTVLDRKDNDGHYSCGHCSECLANKWLKNIRWLTPKRSLRNSRRNIRIEFQGQSMCLTEVAEILNVRPALLLVRYRKGLRGEALLTTKLYANRAPKYSHGGLTLTAEEWAERTGLHKTTICRQFKAGTFEALQKQHT